MNILGQFVKHPIYSVSDGQYLGTVKDFYLDDQLQQITGIHLESEGLFSRTSRLIRANFIQLYGVEVIFVTESEIVLDSEAVSEVNEWVLRETIQGRLVQSQSARDIGTISDVMINNTGQIKGFSLSKVKVSGHIAENNAISRKVMDEPGSRDLPMIIDQIKAEQPSHQLHIS